MSKTTTVRLAMSLILIIFLSGGGGIYAGQKENKELDKYFAMSIQELLNLEIYTAGKTDEKISAVPASVVLVTRNEIERYGYSSIKEILKNVAGLYVIDNQAYMGAVVGVRGYYTGTPRNVIVLVNGVDQADCIGQYQLQNYNLPVEAVDRIEVVRGPISIMYGSGAFFGVINIITNEVTQENTTSLVSVSLGSEKTKKAALRFAYNKNDVSLVFNSGYFDTNGPDEPYSKMVSDMSTLEQYGISEANNNTSTGGRLEHQNLYLSLSAKYKGLFADISFLESSREECHYWPSPDEGLLNKKNFTTALFGFERELSAKFSIKGAFKYFKSTYWRDFDYFIDDFYGQELCNSLKMEIELNAFFKLSDNFTLTTGLNFKEKNSDFKLDIRTLFQLSTGNYIKNIRAHAVYIQADYSPFKKLKLVAGFRLENPMKYSLKYINNQISYILETDFEPELELVPRIAAIVSINENNILKLLYGKAVQYPAPGDVLSQKFSSYDDLETEYINTLEINYLTNITPAITLNLSVFQNKLENLMVQVLEFDDNGNWAPRNSNAGKMVTNGVELMLYTTPFEGFLLELSGTYQKSQDKREGFENRKLAYSPAFLGYIKASYSLNKNSTAALTGRYVSAMETLWDISKENPDGSLGGRIAARVDGYFVLDGNLRFNNLLGKGYYLNIHCSNLFDTDYLYPLYTSNSGWADKGTFGHGRTVLVGIGCKFQ